MPRGQKYKKAIKNLAKIQLELKGCKNYRNWKEKDDLLNNPAMPIPDQNFSVLLREDFLKNFCSLTRSKAN